jgi:uncharacterized protein (TIGR00255 family)
MIRSMTGFGSAEGEVGGAQVAVEIRSVNHRFFNPTIKLPIEYSRWEGEVREALRRAIGRGHVTLTARVERQASNGQIDEERFADYVARLRELQTRYGLDAALDIGTILRLPEVLAASRAGTEAEGNAAELVAVVARALSALDSMRVAEGARLVQYVKDRLSVVASAVDRIAERAPRRLLEQRERLRQSVRELADGVAVDDQRLAQEIAVLADRLDVSEEVSRFRSHLEAFRGALRDTTSDGVGKRLGFLLQELLREANTTGSKANDSVMTQDVLLIKEELERIREQVENLE